MLEQLWCGDRECCTAGVRVEQCCGFGCKTRLQLGHTEQWQVGVGRVRSHDAHFRSTCRHTTQLQRARAVNESQYVQRRGGVGSAARRARVWRVVLGERERERRQQLLQLDLQLGLEQWRCVCAKHSVRRGVEQRCERGDGRLHVAANGVADRFAVASHTLHVGRVGRRRVIPSRSSRSVVVVVDAVMNECRARFERVVEHVRHQLVGCLIH